MTCEHEFRLLESSDICCMKCGIQKKHVNPILFTFHHPAPCTRRVYSREVRFFRLLANIEGKQNVRREVIQAIPEEARESLESLANFLRESSELRAQRNKIASIWYQLGHRWPSLSWAENEHAKFVFRAVNKKISYLILLPYVLCEIGRADLVKFTKPISKNMQKQYSAFLKGTALESILAV